jgi:thiol-disulfide isomerase/thioredoxin
VSWRSGRAFLVPWVIVVVTALVLSGCSAATMSTKRTALTEQLATAAALAPCTASTNAPKVQGGLPNLTLPCLGDGPAVRLSGLRGKPLLVNVWAGPCLPCQREAPEIQKVYAAAGDRLEVLGIVYGPYPESIDDALDASRGLGLHYPSVFDADGKIRDSIRSAGIPFTVFVAADGTIAYVQRGEILSGELPGMVERYLGVKL